MENEIVKEGKLFDAIIQLFYKPNSAFAIIKDKWELNHHLILLGLFGVLNSLASTSFIGMNTGMILTMILFKGLIGAALGWGGIWLMSKLINFLNIAFGGDSSFEDVFMIFSFALIPFIISLSLNITMKFLLPNNYLIIFSLLSLILFIWTWILLIIGNKMIAQLNTIKSTISVLIPFIIFVFLGVLIFLIKN